MMLSETQFLSQSCENCGSTEYMEHDSGFYVCVNCAVVSQMRHGLALDYKDLNTKGMKFKRKNVEENEDDDQVDLNNFETNMNTVNNTCANSEYNDSVTSKLTKLESAENRPLSGVLLEHQVIFFKIFKSVFFYQFMKKKRFLILSVEKNEVGDFHKFGNCGNINENYENAKKKNENNYNLLEEKDCFYFNAKSFEENNVNNNYRNFTKNFYVNLLSGKPADKAEFKSASSSSFSSSSAALAELEIEAMENYKCLLELAKEKWMLFIKSEYENQIKKRGPNFRKRGMRSRRNTEDEFSQINTIASHNTNQNKNNNNNNNNNNNFQSINSSNLNLQNNPNNTNNIFIQKTNNNPNNLNNNNINIPNPSMRNRDKRSSINDELKSRKIKPKNIIQLDAYKNTRLRNKEKKKKFIEEHDQVLNMLKKAQEYIKSKTALTIEDTVSFNNMLILADLFGIKVNENATYEDLIHAFFIAKELNYRNLYSEKTFDENKTNLTPDNFLCLLYECFSNKINSFNKDFPILIYELISLYKKLNLNLHSQEIKFLKYLSKEKLFKSLENTKLPLQLQISSGIEYIAEKLLKLPLVFKSFAQSIFKICEFSISKNLSHVYNYEAFGIAVVIISLRFFYGFNDLPYLVEMQKLITFTKGFFANSLSELLEENKKLNEIFSLFREITKKDQLHALYAQMPSTLELIESLFSLIKEEESSTGLWEGIEFKKHLGLEFKSKYAAYNNHFFFPKLENSSCVRNINELEKKIEAKLEKIISSDKDFGKIEDSGRERKMSLVYRKHSYDGKFEIYSVEDENDKNKNKNLKDLDDVDIDKNSNNNINDNYCINGYKKDISVNIKFSEKFRNKINSKKKLNFVEENTSINSANEKANANKNNSNNISIKNLNKFLKEEIAFYRMLTKKNKKNKKIAIPLPCDTIVRYNKKAFKFEGIVPPTTELMIYYLFSRYFKIEVQVIRKCLKILEKVIDGSFK